MADAGRHGSSSPAAHGDPQPSIAEVQARILEQLQAARAVLTARSSSGALPKDELAEVLEELSHSTALLATVKRDLDGMFSRLRRTRAALAAAFPQHAVAPRRVVSHEEEDAVPGLRQQQGQQEGQQQQQQDDREIQPAAEGEDARPDEQRQQQQPAQQQGQQEHAQQGVQPQGWEASTAAAAAGEAQQQEDEPAELQPDAAEQQQGVDGQAGQQVKAQAAGAAAAGGAADASTGAPPSS